MITDSLPRAWVGTNLAEAVGMSGLISDGDWIESKDQDVMGSVRLIQLADIGDGDFRNKSSRYMTKEKADLLKCTFLKKGDVLVARMPDPLGRACIFPGIDQEAVTVVDICLIRTTPNSAVDSSLLKYWINSPVFRAVIDQNASGTTRKRITRKKLEKFEFPLPPLAEQKVIAEKLDTLLAQVEATKARLESTLQTLKQFRQSVLAAAVSGKLTEDWRLSNGIKSSWQDLTLGDVIINGPQNGIYKPSKLYGSGTKIIRIDGFYDGELCDWSSFKRVLVEDQEKDKWALKENDILINRVNSIEYLGKCGLVRSLPEDAIFESNIMRISVNEGKAIPEFIKIFLTSLIGLDRLRANAKLAVNQASINQKDVKSCQLELPEFNEQQEIIRRVNLLFSGTDVTEQQIHQALERVNNLTQSILVKAFRGELTEQWRRDNPKLVSGENSAEALLEKIKAERAALKSVKKSRK